MERSLTYGKYRRISMGYTPEKGFTLVEVLIAMVVLSLGLLGAVALHISAVGANTAANAMTNAVHLAQSRLEALMALEYTRNITDPNLLSDDKTTGKAESYTDADGNGLWDYREIYMDANHNGVWDAAHVDPNPPPGYVITWSVTDNRPVPFTKYIRMCVTEHTLKRPLMFTCIKSRQ